MDKMKVKLVNFECYRSRNQMVLCQVSSETRRSPGGLRKGLSVTLNQLTFS